FFADEFQCNGASQIDVERFVSHAHRTATQLDRFPIFARDKLVMLESLHRLFWSRLECIPRRRLAGLNPTGKPLAKHADRTKIRCSGKLIAANRADASVLRVHGLNLPSIAYS